jgi:hypothetical protein
MSDDNDMTCAELSEAVAELALGVLTGRERALAVTHLDDCDACREDLRQLTATGERLLELLPPAEPPAGFETRVLARLGLPTPSGEPTQPIPAIKARPLPPRGPGQGSGGGGGHFWGKRRHRPPGRPRRTLAAAAVAIAVAAAGAGGWGLGTAMSPKTVSATSQQAAGPLTAAALVAAGGQSVGKVFLYTGAPSWVYMYVDLETGHETVTCQLVTADGQVHTLDSTQLADGYGSWTSPSPGSLKHVTGARLVSTTGKVLATATFPH